MAFLTPALPSLRRAGHRRVICAQYLPPDSLNVAFDYPSKAGNFGYVFFGEYNDRNTGQTTEIVVKCPIETPIGRQLFNMEKHTNAKLRQKSSDKSRFAEYLGEIILPADVRLTPGLARMGLVWERVGGGETLEDYLSASRVPVLANILGTSASGFPLRRELGGRVLKELAVIVENLQQCGIVHRDIKPENLLVVSGDREGSPFKAIDFGSSCDWSSPLKKGLRLATCDPVYTAPERRLDIFKPAYRFDVYSIGLIALRCALPSLTESTAMNKFVEENLSESDFCLQRTCSGLLSGRLQSSPSLLRDIEALTGPEYEDMYALFATVLTTNPSDRADVSDCLRSRFVQAAVPSQVI